MMTPSFLKALLLNLGLLVSVSSFAPLPTVQRHTQRHASTTAGSLLRVKPLLAPTITTTTTTSLLTHAPTLTPTPRKKGLFSFLRRRGGASGNDNSADVKAAFTECVGTGLLTAVIGMMASTLAGLTGGVQAAGAGAALFVLLLAGAKSSGAHYNPIVTTALVLLGKMSLGKGLMYVISQVIGGLAGGFLAKGLTGGMLGDPSFTLSGASFFTEVFFSFTLILTVLQSAVAKSQQGKNVFAPAIATVVGLGAALGASMNPAVSWGLFSAAGKDKGSLALWLFPLMATLPAAIIYRLTDPDENDAKTEHVSFLPKIFNDKTTKSVGPYVNEYVGTFLLTSVVSLAVATGRVAAPIAASLMFMAMTFSGAYVSGTHVNPAVTAGLFFRKGGDRTKAVGYGVAQILGALMAAGLSHAALGAEVCKGKILPQLGQGVTEGQAMGTEMLFTGLLMQAVFSFGAQGTPTAVLAITGTLMAGLAAAGGVSGGALNPAVATALYLKNAAGNQINNLYVYWLGPCLGAVLVALVNKKIGEDESLGGKAQNALNDAQNRAQGAMNDAQAAFNNAMPQQ